MVIYGGKTFEKRIFAKILRLFEVIDGGRVNGFLIFWSRWIRNGKISLS